MTALIRSPMGKIPTLTAAMPSVPFPPVSYTHLVDQVAELLVGLLVGQAQQLEHPVLEGGVSDADGAGGQLDTVEHHVVALGPDLALAAFVLQVGKALVHDEMCIRDRLWSMFMTMVWVASKREP